MPQQQAVAIAFVIALAMACLLALQLMLSFRTMEEFDVVVLAIAGDVVLATVTLVLALRQGAGQWGLAWTAAGLGLATIAVSGLPPWMDLVDSRSSDPYPSDHRDAQIVMEFLLPSLAAIVVLWRLLERARRRAAGLDPRTAWPWITIAVGLIAVFNPLGLEIIAAALAHSPSNWLWGLDAFIAAAVAAVLAILAVLEVALRARRRPRSSFQAEG